MRIFTIGYGGLAPTDFITALKRRGIQSVVDIRIWPIRSVIGYYTLAKDREKGIRGLLNSEGIGYHAFLELGNPYLELLDWKDHPYLHLPDWKDRYRRLVEAAGDLLTERLGGVAGPLCLLCAERDPDECHRAILADFLEKRGHDVEHIRVST